MKVTIEIECDEDNEIAQHLDKLRKDFIKAIKKGQIAEGFTLVDNNCYGNHSVEVTDYN